MRLFGDVDFWAELDSTSHDGFPGCIARRETARSPLIWYRTIEAH